MCEFISWKEITDDKGKLHLLYLTGDDIWNTKRGKELRDYCKCNDDLVGHGAIDYFFKLKGKGINKECTDFSTPLNFPDEIVQAIKKGLFRGMGTPEGLLSAPALAEYNKVKDAALAEYNKVTDAALAEYNKVKAPALAEYNKVTDAAWAEYNKVTAPAWAEYNKVKDAALAEYNKVTDDIFWDLFANPKNRNKNWK